MRFCKDSPFGGAVSPSELIQKLRYGRACFGGYAARRLALAQTKDGRHVILQQASRSCVPACAAMLILDRGKPLSDYMMKRVQTVDLATREDLRGWLSYEGFKFQEISFKETASDAEKLELLQQRLEQCGPGILGIDDFQVGGHAIVLDSISIDTQTAEIRDPVHGWAVTVSLSALLSRIEECNCFTQIRD